MRISRKFCAVTGAAVAAAALTVSGAGAASASSHLPPPFGGSGGGGGWGGPGGGVDNCTGSGIYSGYCGTQKSGTGLYITVSRNGQIVGAQNPRGGSDEFLWFADAGSTKVSGGDYYLEYAPRGAASGKVLAVAHGHVVLAPASGAADQKWTTGSSLLKNVGSGDVLQAGNNNQPLQAVTPGATIPASEKWTYANA
jgi:hypothetical protein